MELKRKETAKRYVKLFQKLFKVKVNAGTGMNGAKKQIYGREF